MLDDLTTISLLADSLSGEDVSKISALLRGEDASLQAMAAFALWRKNNDLASLALLKYEDKVRSPLAQQALARVLGKIACERPYLASEIAERLLKYIVQDSSAVRHSAVVGLTELLKDERNKSIKAIYGLVTLIISDPEPIIRYAAAEGMGTWGTLRLQDIRVQELTILDLQLLTYVKSMLEKCARPDELEVGSVCSYALELIDEMQAEEEKPKKKEEMEQEEPELEMPELEGVIDFDLDDLF